MINYIPKYEEIKEDFYSAIRQGVKVSVINAKDDINKYLNEDTGELKLRTPFSIFVGGQVLDRDLQFLIWLVFIMQGILKRCSRTRLCSIQECLVTGEMIFFQLQDFILREKFMRVW